MENNDKDVKVHPRQLMTQSSFNTVLAAEKDWFGRTRRIIEDDEDQGFEHPLQIKSMCNLNVQQTMNKCQVGRKRLGAKRLKEFPQIEIKIKIKRAVSCDSYKVYGE